VLRDQGGVRWIRTGWCRDHVRPRDHTASPQQITGRMRRVGWAQPGETGRAKATRPRPDRNIRLVGSGRGPEGCELLVVFQR
jgi:hypothetical protein